jgi:hypothetical protein
MSDDLETIYETFYLPQKQSKEATIKKNISQLIGNLQGICLKMASVNDYMTRINDPRTEILNKSLQELDTIKYRIEQYFASDINFKP